MGAATVWGWIMRFKLEGVVAAMVTPFMAGGEKVDLGKVGPLANHLFDKGVHGLFVCGTTGEFALLSTEERMAILEEVVGASGKRGSIVAHTAAPDTATTIALTRHAQAAGAKAAAIVTPWYYKYDDLALLKFYKEVAAATPKFPILLYNIPGCARNALSAELILRLVDEVENIVGIKDSAGGMPLQTRLIGAGRKGFTVFNGCDEMGYQSLVAGAQGVVSGTANVVGELYVAVYNHVRKGQLKRAWAAQVKLEEACRVLEYGSQVGFFKEAMRIRGFDPGFVRPPQRELTATERGVLAKALQGAGLA